jgi:ribosomal protein L11 methylase PrmA
MAISMSEEQHPASFRDPSGFLFRSNGVLYRQINQSYTSEYDHLINSGLYNNLETIGRIVSHEETNVSPFKPEISYKVIRPDEIPFISYPYEWCFSQLKEAALVTLNIQERALQYGMSLKDASAYNIQFTRGKATLIDTLSFEFYQEGQPWVAYKQFCQHFLAPLALMAKKDIELGKMLRLYIDGIPLGLTSELLPISTRLNPGLMMHIHLHARAQEKYAGQSGEHTRIKNELDKQSFLGLLESLKKTVEKLDWEPSGTHWGNYYEDTNYSSAAFKHKKHIITRWVKEVNPKQVWDLGANNGVFSRLASEEEVLTISFDIDPAAVEQNQRLVKSSKEKNILPILMDVTNPSPAIGWRNWERESLTDRSPAEMVFALALMHHLAISNNVPFPNLAAFFSDIGNWLIIEFIPKSDSQVQKMLQSRLDIFDEYTQMDFEQIFERYFKIRKKEKIQESVRYLYLMEKR